MINKILNTITQFNMLKKGDSIVVGVSGGADSICLLDVLNSLKEEYRLSLTVVHINHNIRGKDADSDEEYVIYTAEKYGLPYKVFSYSVEKMAREKGIGTEEMGRSLRYKAFYEVAGNEGKIAVAHNINDNCETMLMNFMRGTGLKGLSGIAPVRGQIIRPLIAITKDEIISYCNEKGLKYCNDYTNDEEIYTRNKLRLNIIPQLEKAFNKNLASTLFRTSNIIRSEEEYIEKESLAAYNNCLEANHRLNINKLEAYDRVIQRRAVRIGFRDFLEDLHDISYDHVSSVLMLMDGESGRVAELPQGLRAIREHNSLYFYRENNYEDFCYTIIPEEKQYIKEINSYILLTKYKKIEHNSKIIYTIAFNCDKINRELLLRSRKSGDKIYFNGINGSKSLKKLFIDLKIPKSQRNKIPVLAMDNEVLWIKDYKTSDFYKADEASENIIYLYLLEE